MSWRLWAPDGVDGPIWPLSTSLRIQKTGGCSYAPARSTWQERARAGVQMINTPAALDFLDAD